MSEKNGKIESLIDLVNENNAIVNLGQCSAFLTKTLAILQSSVIS
jgi:hypothetical protein